jgi:hypothetical protein
MQYISRKAITIVAPDTANRLPLEAAFKNRAEGTEPASILPVRFDRDMKAQGLGFPAVYGEPIEEYLEVDPKYTAWKVVTAWTGAAIGGWALVIGCVMVARALLP